MNTYKYLIIIIFCSMANSSIAVTKHTGIWSGFVIMGPLQYAKDIKYYADGELKLIDDPYKFDEIYSSIGLGKQLDKNLFLLLANRLIAAKQISNGNMNYEYRLWQEADWNRSFASMYNISARSRLEERKRFSQPVIAIRYRQRIMLREKLPLWHGHSFVIYDEIFMNLNRPIWVVDTFLEQNRFLLG